jgi:hypothetical protein
MTCGSRRPTAGRGAFELEGVALARVRVVLLAAAFAACARHESKEPTTKLAPAPTTIVAAGSGTAGTSAAMSSPAQPPVDEATRAAVRRMHEMIAEADREKVQGEASDQSFEAEQRKAWQEEQRRVAGEAATSRTLLGAFTREDIIRAAGTGKDGSLMWLASEWRPRKDTIAALSFRPTQRGYPVQKLEPRLVLLQNNAGKLARVTDKKLDLSRVICSNEGGEAPGGWEEAPKLALDLAAYDIAPGQTALGIRLTCMYTVPAGDGVDTQLLLLELKDGHLRQILETSVGRNNFDRPSENRSTTTGVLVVQREQHAGYYDLQLREKIQIESEADPAIAKNAHSLSERSETKRFIWNGDHYVQAPTP